MLRYAQHDKSESNHGECSFLSFRAKRGIQYGCFTALRFVQHDKRGVIPSAFFLSFRALFFCHSERSEESSMDASLRLRSVQHDRRCHSERSEESSVDASLRSA